MNRLHLFALLAILMLGASLIGGGAIMWNRAEYGSTIVNWITPSHHIPNNGYMWTWGVAGIPSDEPDEWHFHVIFSANRTAVITLVWNLNETTLFERRGAAIDESFAVQLPRTNAPWRWDWRISNPNSSVLGVANFTVTHYSIKFPLRHIGSIA